MGCRLKWVERFVDVSITEARAMTRLNPVEFARQVRQEVSKVTWPTRKETGVTTMMVFVFVAIMSVFFLVVDQVAGMVVRAILGLGGAA